MTNEARFFLFTLFEAAYLVTLLCYGFYVYPRVSIQGELAVIGVFAIAIAVSNTVMRAASNRIGQSDLPNRVQISLRVVSAFGATSLSFLLGLAFISAAEIVTASYSSVLKLSLMAGLGVGAAGLAGLYLSRHERFGFPVRLKGDSSASDGDSTDAL